MTEIALTRPNHGTLLHGCHSFVEDFLRNGDSVTHARKAAYGPAWRQDANGVLAPITQVQFTADPTRLDTINAGAAKGRFFLTTGGETANTDTKLWQNIILPADDKRTAPADLPWPQTTGTREVPGINITQVGDLRVRASHRQRSPVLR